MGDSPAERPEPRLLQLSQLVDDLRSDAAARHDAHTKGIPRGPVSGLPSLDRALGGVLEAGLHVLHGGPGVGKTAFALQAAASCGCPALYVTTEMRPLELFRRIIARTTDTFLGRLKSGEYDVATVAQKAEAAVRAAANVALVDACDTYASPDFLHDAAENVRQSPYLRPTGTPGDPVLVVVDSIHSWSEADPDRRGLTEYDRLGDALDGLRQLAGRLRCPIVVVAERNRASMREGGLYASAGNRAFEYSCESMVSLDVAEKEPAPSADERVLVARIEKNRHGAAHSKGLKLAFHGALQRFRDLESAEPWGAR